jgi:HAD superfamily hydrolase (TIGR01509 family)
MTARATARPVAVILDMDGTLLDTEPVAARAWFDAASELGIGFEPTLPHRLIGRTFTDCRALIAQAHDADYPVDALMARWHAAYDAIVEREGVALKPGAAELVDWLAAEGIARAVATSTRRARALVKLEHAALARHMHAIVGGDEVASGKPAPDIFLAAASRLGVVPARCVVIEDSAAGVAGAQAAGMAAIMVPDLVAPDASLRATGVLVVETLARVREHLAALPR